MLGVHRTDTPKPMMTKVSLGIYIDYVITHTKFGVDRCRGSRQAKSPKSLCSICMAIGPYNSG
jgi:hypothetical protein